MRVAAWFAYSIILFGLHGEDFGIFKVGKYFFISYYSFLMYLLSVPERSEGTEVSKIAIRNCRISVLA